MVQIDQKDLKHICQWYQHFLSVDLAKQIDQRDLNWLGRYCYCFVVVDLPVNLMELKDQRGLLQLKCYLHFLVVYLVVNRLAMKYQKDLVIYLRFLAVLAVESLTVVVIRANCQHRLMCLILTLSYLVLEYLIVALKD